MTNVRYDFWPQAGNRDTRRTIHRANHDDRVPERGEIVSIHGNPYIVHNIGSATGPDIDDNPMISGEQWVYVDLFACNSPDENNGYPEPTNIDPLISSLTEIAMDAYAGGYQQGEQDTDNTGMRKIQRAQDEAQQRARARITKALSDA